MARTTCGNGHVRLRNIERGHLRDVDVAGRAAQVVVVDFRAIRRTRVRVVTELEREALWHIFGPTPEPIDRIRRKRRRLNDCQRSRFVVGGCQMAAVAVIRRWFLSLPMTTEARRMTIFPAEPRNGPKGVAFDLLERRVRLNRTRQRHCSAIVYEVAGRANVSG